MSDEHQELLMSSAFRNGLVKSVNTLTEAQNAMRQRASLLQEQITVSQSIVDLFTKLRELSEHTSETAGKYADAIDSYDRILCELVNQISEGFAIHSGGSNKHHINMIEAQKERDRAAELVTLVTNWAVDQMDRSKTFKQEIKKEIDAANGFAKDRKNELLKQKKLMKSYGIAYGIDGRL